MNNKEFYAVSIDSVRNEIRKIINENERFISGKSDKEVVYAGEVTLTQLRRLERIYDGMLGIKVVQARKGVWIGEGLGFWDCSYCNFRISWFNKSSYCPYCGADMQEES